MCHNKASSGPELTCLLGINQFATDICTAQLQVTSLTQFSLGCYKVYHPCSRILITHLMTKTPNKGVEIWWPVLKIVLEYARKTLDMILGMWLYLFAEAAVILSILQGMAHEFTTLDVTTQRQLMERKLALLTEKSDNTRKGKETSWEIRRRALIEGRSCHMPDLVKIFVLLVRSCPYTGQMLLFWWKKSCCIKNIFILLQN